MNKATGKLREEARELFLTGQMATNAEIAARLRLKPHTVGAWRKQEDWDGLRLKIDRRAAEQMAERIATDRVNLNSQHYKLWQVVVSQLFESLKTGVNADKIREMERVASILDRAQKGQRLARGLSTDGKAEEQIRAEFEADARTLIDHFIEVVKEEVPDAHVRDRIARAILERLPAQDDEVQ